MHSILSPIKMFLVRMYKDNMDGLSTTIFFALVATLGDELDLFDLNAPAKVVVSVIETAPPKSRK